MFRKLLLAGAVSLGVLAPVAVTSAHEYHHREHHYVRHHERDYRVFYSDPCRPGWQCAGTFCDYHEAQRCAEQYSCRGFAISIR